MSSVFEIGALLEVRGEPWRLTHASPFGGCTILTLEGRDASSTPRRLRVIAPFDRVRPIPAGRLTRRSRPAVLREALSAIAEARPALGLWTAAGAAIDLLPYQLEPALAVIGGATRLLLADAVGLGKTIQAGLVLAELRERGWVDRALVLCPSGLRATWDRELRERFRIDATVLDQAALAETAATLPPGINPWSGHAVTIASIDLVKRPDVLAAVAAEPIDLLIADEAHHLTPGTDRGAAVARLAARAPWCVLVSATPHSGDEAAFDYLTSLGGLGDPIAIFRRSRQDAGLPSRRRSHVLPIMPGVDETALLAAVEAYTRALWIAKGRDQQAVRLLAVTLARRAASSPLALERTLARRLALLAARPVEPLQPQLPWDDEDDEDGALPDALLATPGLHSVMEERQIIERILALARCCGAGSKIRRIARLLDRIREPIVVFTEYRDSVDAVVAEIAMTHRVAVIHGGLAPALRRDTVEAFNAGLIDVLVATDAAGEGLNLHHRCRVVIDLELPWNPLRLEQRIGRVDRLGQQRAVHAIRLVHPRSIEQRVLARLQLRQRRAEHAMADVFATEREIAAAVFDDVALAVRRAPAIASDRVTERIAAAAAEAGRLEHQRRVRRLPGASAGVAWAPPRRDSGRHLLLLHRIQLLNELGVRVDEHLAVTRATLRCRPINRRELRLTIARLRHEPRLIELLKGNARARIESLSIDLGGSRSPLLARLCQIRERLQREARAARQASLFDRRAETAAAIQRAAIQRLDAALDRRLAGLASPLSSGSTRITLVAAWFIRP